MKLRLLAYACLFALPFVTLAAAPPRYELARGRVIRGGPVDAAAKAAVDSFLLLGPSGSGAPYVGDFEGSAGGGWNGWTSEDETQTTVSRWHAATYQAVSGAYSAWCGDLVYPSCDGGLTDPDGGYGNNWNEMLEWRGAVTDPAAATTVQITATANIDTETGYDFVYLSVEKAGIGFVDLRSWYGRQPGVAVDEMTTYLPGDYVGAGGDEVVVLFRFISDGGWSDEDCSWPTAGAVQLDDVTIVTDNGVGTGGVVDFEGGTLLPFTTRLPVGVGNFAALWSRLRDADPCVENTSCQVAFIDDGLVVPGTGGTTCLEWCYGPGGYIVNNSGGLAGPESHLANHLISPAMTWPNPGHESALLTYGVYKHDDPVADHTAAGMFYDWSVRMTDTGDPSDLEDVFWRSDVSLYHGAAAYRRPVEPLAGYLDPDPTHVQVRLSVLELGHLWGWEGDNGTPAPYFDNVRLMTHPVAGPDLAARDIDLAQDAFPASGTLDLADPGALSVRFDMARNVALKFQMRNDPGDSLVIDAIVRRHDAVLEGLPRFHYKVARNPVFVPYKTSPLADEGVLDCAQVVYGGGYIAEDRFSVDLPDTGFLFPGDQVHYFFTASDRDTLTDDVRTAILPADTTGFGDFDDPEGYDPAFTMRCLPSLGSLQAGEQPPFLFWIDFGEFGKRAEWFTALREFQMAPGRDYDIYETNGPKSGVGNGLGGRATAAQLADYDVLLYSAGTLSFATLGNGDYERDPSPDVQVLTQWLDSGDKGLFAGGDGLASDLWNSGTAARDFLTDMMGLDLVQADVRELIGGQSAPRVLTTATEPVFDRLSSWVAFGGCPDLNAFDAVIPVDMGTSAQRLAEFAGPGGDAGGYPYSAATLASGVGFAGTSEVISLPYDFGSIRTDPKEVAKAYAGLSARLRILMDVIEQFGFINPIWDPSAVPEARAFAVSQHPNPFNPVTTITYTAPRPGRLTVKVYDLRGRLVRTVFDDQVTVSGSVDWDGTDDRGAQAASGVYFYEANLGGEVEIGKMALIK